MEGYKQSVDDGRGTTEDSKKRTKEALSQYDIPISDVQTSMIRVMISNGLGKWLEEDIC